MKIDEKMIIVNYSENWKSLIYFTVYFKNPMTVSCKS